MAEYNGHKSWDHWNVALWLNNDEGLYRLTVDCIDACESAGKDLHDAALMLLEELDITYGITETPDGAEYTLDTIYEALNNN